MALQEVVTNDTGVNVAAVVYLLGNIVDRVSEVNDSGALGQVSQSLTVCMRGIYSVLQAVVKVSEVLLQRTKENNEVSVSRI